MSEDTSGNRRAATIEGTVTEALPNALYAVELRDGQMILARLAGTIQMRGTRVIPGDRVTIELSAYDQNRGRIVQRNR